MLAVRRPTAKLIVNPERPESIELFDLRTALHEMRNQATNPKYAKSLRALQTELAEQKEQFGQPAPRWPRYYGSRFPEEHGNPIAGKFHRVNVELRRVAWMSPEHSDSGRLSSRKPLRLRPLMMAPEAGLEHGLPIL
jgi:hypothetical protein